jgi:hypothetical protein
MRNFTGYGEAAFALFLANRIVGGILCGAAAYGIAQTLKKMGVVGQSEGYRVVQDSSVTTPPG